MQGLILKNGISIGIETDYLYDRLERLFFINTNEILGFYEDGSQILDFFWEPATPTTVRAIVFEVKRLLYKYEPTLDITAINSGLFPDEGGEMLMMIEIEFMKKSELDIYNYRYLKLREK